MTTARFALLVAGVALVLIGEAAANPVQHGTSNRGVLYLTDSAHGRIYTYDPRTHESSPASLLSIGQAAAGAITFYHRIAYVAVGATGSNRPGLYRFNASAPAPVARRIGEPVSAQAVDVLDATKGYLTVANFVSLAATPNGVYTFDPSNPAAGLDGPLPGTITTASGVTTYPQGIVTGPDSRVYVADYRNGEVMQIDPSSNSVTRVFKTSAGGTSGLAVGSFEGAPGVLVANEGAYVAPSERELPGSIDFIDSRTDTIREVTSSVRGERGSASVIHPLRLLMTSPSTLIALGDSQTLLVSISDGRATRLLASGSPFGGSDIALADGMVYIADGNYEKLSSKLYVMSPSGAQEPYSPVTVMKSGKDCIAGIAYKE